MWKKNARFVAEIYGNGYVNWEERFYVCPECAELIYEEDWTDEDFEAFLCPICEFYE